jgi:nucleotide-binding universal stress UspA family protein
MTTVLVCTDGSEHSLRILPYAGLLARFCSCSLSLLEVVDAGVAADVGERRHQEDSLRAQLDAAGLQGEALLEPRGEDEDVCDAVLRVARARGADLIAIGSQGHGALHHLLMGSTALSVVSRAHLPVMTSGPRLSDPTPAEEYRLLVTYDGSEASARAVDAVAPLVEGGVRVTLLSVLQAKGGKPLEAGAVAACEDELRALAARLPAQARPEVKAFEIPPLGGVDTAIIETAAELGAHAIAMATHGVGAARHLLLGGTALSILGRSPVPLILVRGLD